MTAFRTARLSALAALALTFCVRIAAQAAELPSYKPSPLSPGVLRSWGNDAMRPTLVAWEKAFRKYHPEIAFQDALYGSGTGMAGIITGVSDLALMGRTVTANEVIGFEWVHRTKPLGVQVLTGGLHGEGKTSSLGVHVSRTNPLQSISMAQLATVLGCPAEPQAPVTWAAAGADGSWVNRPLHAYLFDSQTGTGAFLQQAVQGSKDCWNWSIVHEFKDEPAKPAAAPPASRQIIDALRHDPDGLAISTLGYKGADIKLLPVSRDQTAVLPSAASLVAETYPLTRGVYIYIRRDKDKPVPPLVKEFLEFILSREGQAIAASVNDYLPLSSEGARAERAKLQ